MSTQQSTQLIEDLIEVAREKLAYVMSAYGPEFRNKANELKTLIAKAETLIMSDTPLGSEIDRLRAELAAERKAREEAQRQVNELNDVLRAAGWGQGEIDSCAETIHKAEQRADDAQLSCIAAEEEREFLRKRVDATEQRLKQIEAGDYVLLAINPDQQWVDSFANSLGLGEADARDLHDRLIDILSAAQKDET